MIRRLRSEDLENQLNRGALWAVTYGDLMSYLMIFFLIMFSFGVAKQGGSTSKDRKFQETLVGIQKVSGGAATSPAFERAVKRENEESMARQLKETIELKDLSKYAKVETMDKKIRLILSEGVLFDSGKAELKPGSLHILKTMTEQLRAAPNPIVIEGHTDNVPVRSGRYGSNWELSMARAYSVMRFLESRGVRSERLSGSGYGEHRPAGDNKTAEGRAKNRRIEIDLLRTD
jgi:chemotaxis protein MotB